MGVCAITDREWRRWSPGAGSVLGENEDRVGEEEQASFKWKWVRGVSKVGGKRECVWVLCVCVHLVMLYRTCSFLCLCTGEYWRNKCVRKREKEENRKSGKWWRWEGLPDTEVCTAGVVAANGGDSACVCAYVTWPGLGDVEGAVCIQPHARDGLDVNHWALLLPDMPGTQSQTSCCLYCP